MRYDNQDPISWLDRIRFLLFAPAHCGAYAAEIARTFLSGRGWKVIPWGDYTRYKTPLLTELSPGSPLLEKLAEDTEGALSSVPAGASTVYLIAAGVIWAGSELVVVNDDFCRDPLAEKFDEKDHFQVCKPSYDQDEILLRVIEQLA